MKERDAQGQKNPESLNFGLKHAVQMDEETDDLFL